jgi:hypothetical protein
VPGRFGFYRTVLGWDGPLIKEIVIMCITSVQVLSSHQLADLHTRFLVLLPKIETHGRIYFRYLRPHRREEALQEMRALAWLWFLRLAQRGKDAGDYLSTFNDFLVRAVSSGRRVIGTEKAKDAMCVRTQKRRGFKVERLPKEFRASHESLYSTVHGQQEHDAFEERLSDNSITPIPDQAAFRIDWPAWMQTQTERDRRIIDDLMAGERTFDVSQKYGLSPGRISQLRRRLHDDWEEFCAVPERKREAVA